MAFSFFPSFFDHPEKISFADQEEDEKIELFLRRHGVTNIPWILGAALGFLFPVMIFSFPAVVVFVRSFQVPGEVLLGVLVLWYLLVLTYAIEKYLHWYFNIYIVTNQHLVDIDFHNLLSRDKVEVRLDDVQSVKSSFSGIFGPLFNFGNLHIETAAQRQKLDFIAVPEPDLVTERIQDLQEKQEGPRDVT